MTCCDTLLVDETGQVLAVAVPPSWSTSLPPPTPGTDCGPQCEPFLVDDNHSLMVNPS